MKPKILIIAAGIATDHPDLAGGDMRFLEIAKHWIKMGCDVHMLTPKGGEVLCRNFGADVAIHLLPKSKADGRMQAIVDTLQLPFRIPKSIFETDFDAVYSTNEQLYDVIPALFLKWKKGAKIRWSVVVHWLPPFPPWRRHRSTVLNSCLFFFSERLSVWLAKRFADILLPVSHATEKQLLAVNANPRQIQMVECGLPLQPVEDVAAKNLPKIYDAVFLKRVQAVKGALDLPKIWKEVIKAKPEAKLLVIGFGEDFDLLKRTIHEEGLDKNIHLAGLVYELEKKFTLMCQSKLFVLPSYEENWAIVIGEAMGAGLPVIAYGLSELKIVWKDNFVAVPVGDIQAFARALLRLLDNPGEGAELASKARRYVARLDWSAIAAAELNAVVGPRKSLPQSMAVLTGAIYWPAGEKPLPSMADIGQIKEMANYLKKNRALYHVLKENEAAIQGDPALLASLKEGEEHFARLNRSLTEMNQILGVESYITYKTFFGYPRLTSDLDIIVRNISSAAAELKKTGWHAGPIQQGTLDVEKEGALPVGLHERVGWDTPPIFDAELLWAGLRRKELLGHNVIIPSPEVDIMTILAHIPFEKLYLDWGEMCYLYATAKQADLPLIMAQAKKYHWERSLKGLLAILNAAHVAAFGSPSPFEAVYPKRLAENFVLPYECSAAYAARSLIEIGAWKKFCGVVFDPYRMSHFFRGRFQRRRIAV